MMPQKEGLAGYVAGDEGEGENDEDRSTYGCTGCRCCC